MLTPAWCNLSAVNMQERFSDKYPKQNIHMGSYSKNKTNNVNLHLPHKKDVQSTRCVEFVLKNDFQSKAA
jgi:hypothetical protein